MNCHPTLCGMRATIENGTLVEVAGDPENPDSEGFLCVRGHAAQEIIGNETRLLYPQIRETITEPWRRATWEEALDLIATRMSAIGHERVGVWPGHGAVANDFGTFANASLLMRLANMAGCQWWDPSMICWGLGGFGIGLTGALEANTKEDMSANADLVILWGANLASQPNTARHVARAKHRGAKVVAIDIRWSEACRTANEAFVLKPGTDAALALAMMHVVFDEGLQDDAFLASHTVGSSELRAHLEACSPTWAAQITGLPSERIVALARQYAGTKRAMILIGGSSMHKDRHGWQAGRAISCLPAITGKVGREGAGLGPRHAALAHGFGLANILNFERRAPIQPIPSQMSSILEAMESGALRGLILSGTNMVSSFADAGRVGAALSNMDLVVSHDLFAHETSRNHAHVLLPATAWLEDVGSKATATHLYLMDRFLEPPGECRSLADFTRELAPRLGLDDFYPWGEAGHIDAVLDHPATNGATVEALRASGGSLPLEVSPVAHPDLRFPTSSGKIELFSQRAADVGLPGLPTYQPRDGSEHPLELRSGRTLAHFHSFYDAGRALPGLARLESEPEVWLSEIDAEARQIRDGDPIRLFNERGELRAIASVGDAVPPGTLWTHDGWPGLNTLTAGEESLPTAATTLFPFSTGQASFEARVDVARVNEASAADGGAGG